MGLDSLGVLVFVGSLRAQVVPDAGEVLGVGNGHGGYELIN